MEAGSSPISLDVSTLSVQSTRQHLIFLLIILLVFPATKCAHDPSSKYPSVEKTLIRSLLERYQTYGVVGRPVKQSDNLIIVQYGLALIQILDLDENKQVLRTNCWSRYVWKDSLLVWDPKNYSGITQVRVFPHQLWTPDIRLHNFADERLREHRNARVVVHYDGDILWIPQALFKSTCPVEITYFPFDTQITMKVYTKPDRGLDNVVATDEYEIDFTYFRHFFSECINMKFLNSVRRFSVMLECVMEFGSWTYDITQLDIQWWNKSSNSFRPMPYIDFSDYVESNEWRTDGELERKVSHENRTKQIMSTRRMRKVNYRDHRGALVTKEYPVLMYRVRLKRNPSFFVSILVIPCILLSCLTLVLFWLPPESPAKMMLGMNIFVAFFVLLLLLAESTPSAVKNFPLIGGYYCLNMILITLSTFLAVIVINLYFLGDKRGPVPPLVRRVMIDGLGRLLLVRQNIPLPEPRARIPRTKRGSAVNRRDPLERRGNISEAVGRRFRYNKLTLPSEKTDPEDSPLLGVHCRNSLESDLREIKQYVRAFVSRQKEKEARNLIAMEWRTVALVLDRLFFCVYVMAISVAVLTLIPRRTMAYTESNVQRDKSDDLTNT